MSRLTRLSLSDLRSIADTTENTLRTKVLDQFAEDLLLTFLNEDDTHIRDYHDGVIEMAVSEANNGIFSYETDDFICLAEGKDFNLKYEFVVSGGVSPTRGAIQNAQILFRKIEFNFLNNTWDMMSNSFVKKRLVTKMNELEYGTMNLVE